VLVDRVAFSVLRFLGARSLGDFDSDLDLGAPTWPKVAAFNF